MDELEKKEALESEDTVTNDLEPISLPEENTEPLEEKPIEAAEVEETAEGEDAVEAEDPDEGEEGSAPELEAELEELRDMFQKELSAAAAAAENNELIQEMDYKEDSSEEEEIPEGPLCECCGENVCSIDFGENYPYCDSCREMMKRYPLRWSGVFTILLGVILFVATAFFSMNYLETSMAAADALNNFEMGKTLTALQSSYTYLASGKNLSKKVVKKTIDAYINTGYYNDAAALIQQEFNETSLKMPWNAKYQKILTDNETLTATYYAISEIISPISYGMDYDYDEIIAALDALKSSEKQEETTAKETTKADSDKEEATETETSEAAEETKIEYNETFIEYYKFLVMNYSGIELEKQYEQLKYIAEIGEDYQWVFLPNYAAVAAMLSDEEGVNWAFDSIMAYNKEEPQAYIAKANYYRYLETPDPDKMLEVCEEAAANAYNGDTSYKQSEAVAYLLKGEGTLALEAIESALQAGYTVPVCNLYALCGLYNGDTTIYEEMKTLLVSSGYAIADIVEDYKNDKVTIEEALQKKGGEF